MCMDFTTDGRFLMINSSGMGMVVVNAETCKKASPKDMKALRYPQHFTCEAEKPSPCVFLCIAFIPGAHSFFFSEELRSGVAHVPKK